MTLRITKENQKALQQAAKGNLRSVVSEANYAIGAYYRLLALSKSSTQEAAALTASTR